MARPSLLDLPVQERNITEPRPEVELSLAAHRREEREHSLVHADFSKALIEMNRTPLSSRALDLAISIALHVVVIAAPVFFSLWYTDTLNLRSYTSTLLVGPPPPPPPAPAAATAAVRAKVPRRVLLVEGKLIAPTVIPKQIAEIKEAPLPDVPDVEGAAGGVPGGVPGGQMGGVIGGVIGGVLGSNIRPGAPVTPASKPKTPVRIGGRLRPPRAILKEPPEYPSLARQTRIEGDVIIEATINAEGNVVNARIVSGHPLLYQAALEAVRKWRYEPTYLNDEPVPVQMNVVVTFVLK